MFQRILIPTDGSKRSSTALRAAIDVARMSGGTLIALHVVPPEKPDANLPAADDFGALPIANEAGDRRAPERDVALGKAKSAACDAGIALEAERRVDSQPAHAIVDAAEQHHCDLIVMASHGYGDILSIVVGSTTAKVVSGCDVPVLVVH
ncbi:MAG TPA: universal stress protein [Usitatibacter sp.]|nr:universal stress protein [Usitatibacter sp.]